MSRAARATHAGPAPCGHACPVDQNAKEYVALIAEGRFTQSLGVIRRTNPFPSVCGRVCTYPCELECVRSSSGGSVAVRWLKRFVADLAAETGGVPAAGPFGRSRPERVAVVGAGPAGLTAALDLVSLGYGVTVLEARDEPGGLMRWGIPDFRLPPALVRLETRAIEEAGVEILTGRRLGRDTDLDGLLESGFGAVLLAAGAGRQARLGVPGEDAAGVLDTLAFMESGGVAGEPVERRRVVVVGATREGFDAARLASRLCAASVTVITHLESEPMDGSVVAALEQDGVRLRTGLRPVRMLKRGERLVGVGAERISGRGKQVSIKASILLAATDRYVDPGLLGACTGVERGPFGILADPITGETSRKAVFAAGDAVTGPRTVIEAIAAGHRAAASIHLRLSGEEWRPAGRPHPPGPGPVALEITTPAPAPADRRHPLSGPAAAMEEARRCLRCGQCLDCETCHPDCPTAVAMLQAPGSDGPSWDDPLLKMDIEVAGGILSSGRVVLPDGRAARIPVRPVPAISSSRCIGCSRCADACPYEVVQMVLAPDGAGLARIHDRACRGCGSCAGACPVDAVEQPYWESGSLDRAVERPGLEVELACRWGGATTTAVPLPCAGRAGERLLVHALASGASRVEVLDCGDACRFRTGSSTGRAAAARIATLTSRLGLDPGRPAAVPPLDTGKGGDPGPSQPFGLPLGDVERLLARPEVVPARAGLAGGVLRVADRGEILLYTGCLPFVDALVGEDTGDALLGGLRAAVWLLNRAGVVPALADDERSCGLDLRAGGDAEAFRRLAALNAETFERAGARTVVTTCSEAARGLALQAEALAEHPPYAVVHLAAFLDDIGARPHVLPDAGPVALLDDPSDPVVRAAAGRLITAGGGRLLRWRPPRSPARRAHGTAGRDAAIAILGRASAAGASTVVCTSLRRSLGARYALRPGGWDGFGVRVVDLAAYLAGGRP